MAVVNGQDIRRDALATACVERFGKDVLEGLVNKRLIMHHCRNRNIEVTDAGNRCRNRPHGQAIQNRPRAMAANARARARHQRRTIQARYPLADARPAEVRGRTSSTVSDEQLKKAYEAQYGPAVKCRLIVVGDRKQAEQLHRQLIDQPDDFARLAMQHSQDVNSASIGGLIQPIRHHVGDPAIETRSVRACSRTRFRRSSRSASNSRF